MKNIKYLKEIDLNLLKTFILNEKRDYTLFEKLGWGYKNIENHFNKNNNFSIGYFLNNNLCALLIGEKLINNDKYDLEIHIMFVKKKKRKKNIGSSLLSFIEREKKLNNISQIYLEVEENNTDAIKFYEKNNFVFFKIRHSYYNYNKEKTNAKCYFKKL